MTAEDVVRQYVLDELHFRGSEKDLTDDYGLLENEIVDSMGLFNLVGFLEQKFDILITDEELVAENFGTIRSVAELVRSKLT